MNNYILSAILAIVVIALVPSPSEGIQCYTCDSATETKCNDPFSGESMDNSKQDCGMNQICMKTAAKAKGASVVKRSCVFKIPTMEDGCKTVGNADDGEAANCFCSTELCNGSERLKISMSSMLGLVALGILGKKFMGQ